MNRLVIMIAAIFMLFFNTGCIKPSQQRRVIVSFPEQWTAPEEGLAKAQRNCVLMSEDPVSKLPRLNCDLPASDTPTPQSRMFVMDVKFSTTPERQQYVEWVCQRSNDFLVCSN